MSWNAGPQRDPRQQGEYSGYAGYSSQPSEAYSGQAYEQNMSQQYEQQGSQSYQPPLQGQQYVYYQPTYTPISDGRALAAVSYLGGWLSGLLVFLFNRENRLARFHGLQSILFFGSINVLYVLFFFILSFASSLPRSVGAFLVLPVLLLYFILALVAFVGWIVGMVNAGQGKYYKLPFVGNYVERIINQDVVLK